MAATCNHIWSNNGMFTVIAIFLSHSLVCRSLNFGIGLYLSMVMTHCYLDGSPQLQRSIKPENLKLLRRPMIAICSWRLKSRAKRCIWLLRPISLKHMLLPLRPRRWKSWESLQSKRQQRQGLLQRTKQNGLMERCIFALWHLYFIENLYSQDN